MLPKQQLARLCPTFKSLCSWIVLTHSFIPGVHWIRSWFSFVANIHQAILSWFVDTSLQIKPYMTCRLPSFLLRTCSLIWNNLPFLEYNAVSFLPTLFHTRWLLMVVSSLKVAAPSWLMERCCTFEPTCFLRWVSISQKLSRLLFGTALFAGKALSTQSKCFGEVHAASLTC